MQINVPKELTSTMEKRLMGWIKKNQPQLLKQYTVKEFGEILKQACFGRDAYDAVMILDQQGWRSDTELVFILADRAY